jgi:hypothetical protein
MAWLIKLFLNFLILITVYQNKEETEKIVIFE